MEEIKNELEKRRNELLRIRKEKLKALKSAPEGCLRLCRHGEKIQYYHRQNVKDCNGTYIREKDMKLARKLAQKAYDEKILKSVEEELKAIEKYLSCIPHQVAEHIYENMHQGRQQLVKPIKEPMWEYIQKWEQVEYQGKPFAVETAKLYTEKGERVRSKSEVMIADMLYREGISYRYECPLKIAEWGYVYPDFTVLDVGRREEIYWEHFGMMDDPDYAEKAIKKIELYAQNGIISGKNLILTFETKKSPINRKVVDEMIRSFLKT